MTGHLPAADVPLPFEAVDCPSCLSTGVSEIDFTHSSFQASFSIKLGGHRIAVCIFTCHRCRKVVIELLAFIIPTWDITLPAAMGNRLLDLSASYSRCTVRCSVVVGAS